MLSQELFFSGEFHATWVLLPVAAGSGMAARATELVSRTGPLFRSDYPDVFDTQDKDLLFDWMFVCFRVFIPTYGARDESLDYLAWRQARLQRRWSQSIQEGYASYIGIPMPTNGSTTSVEKEE